MEIKKIKLTKADRLEITYTETQADGSTSEISEKHASKAHPDLINAFKELRVHLQVLPGYFKPSDIKDPKIWSKEVDDFHVRSYAIGGEDDDQGIVISGHRIVPSSKKAQILNTPFTRFNEDEATRYKHMDHLLDAIDTIRNEAIAYKGGKFAEDPQQSLEFDKTEETK